MKTDLFHSYGQCWVFQICWHMECSTFTASSFRIWNNSTGIASSLLALFVVMLPRAHLTLIPGCLALGQWSHHRDYLGREVFFLYSSSVYSCHLILSSASVRSIPFLSFIEPIFAWNVPLVSLIILRRSLVIHILLFSSIFALITEEGFLISSCYFWNSAFKWVYISSSPLPLVSLLFSAICKASLDNHFAFCISFSWRWS